MTLTPEQIAAIVPVIVGLLLALTQYLQRQATKGDVANVQTRVDQIHAAVTAPPSVGTNAPPNAYVAPRGLTIQPNPFASPTQTAGLVDGRELPFVKPPGVPLP